MPTTAAKKYLVAELTVKPVNNRRFADLMRHMMRILVKKFRWELLYAGYPTSGELDRFVHIWLVDDESKVFELMLEGAAGKRKPKEVIEELKLLQTQRGIEPPAVQAEPVDKPHSSAGKTTEDQLSKEFFVVYRAIQDLVEKTTHTFMASLPYDPTLLGFQKQTLLVDAEGIPYFFQTEMLSDVDHALTDDQVKPFIPYLKLGTTTGRIKGAKGKDSKDSLFFNLAELKALSIFQGASLELPHANAEKKTSDKTSNASPHVALPPNVSKVVIATPAGEVFELDQGELNRLVRPLQKPEQELKTLHNISKLIAAQVPLASVPDPYQATTIIGDGGMCYVINLSAYSSPENQERIASKLAGLQACSKGTLEDKDSDALLSLLESKE